MAELAKRTTDGVSVVEVSDYIFGNYKGRLTAPPNADLSPKKGAVGFWKNFAFRFIFSHAGSYAPLTRGLRLNREHPGGSSDTLFAGDRCRLRRGGRTHDGGAGKMRCINPAKSGANRRSSQTKRRYSRRLHLIAQYRIRWSGARITKLNNPQLLVAKQLNDYSSISKSAKSTLKSTLISQHGVCSRLHRRTTPATGRS